MYIVIFRDIVLVDVSEWTLCVGGEMVDLCSLCLLDKSKGPETQ